MKRKRRIRYIISMTAALLLLTAGIIFTISISSSAASTPVNMDIDKFRSLSGKSRYINYAKNYHLDMEEAGLLDQLSAVGNWFANFLFTIVLWLGKAVVTLYYFCMNFDLAELFQTDIDKVQKALNSGVFKPLFYLSFCGAAVHMIKTFIKRDVIGSFLQVAKVIGILIMSLLVVNYSSTVISYATGITKGFSTSILLSVNGNEGTKDTASYAAQAAGELWINLIHQPWVFVEFGSDAVTEETINQFLCVGGENAKYYNGSKDREKLIKVYPGTAFQKERAGEKAGFMFLYLFPFLVKSAIYLVMAVLTLAFQLFGIFYVLLAPVVLLLIMIPGYESLLSAWLKKLLETQLGILMMSLLMGVLILTDNLLFEKCAVWGWLVVFLVQTLVLLIVILKRNEILGALGKLQKASTNAGYARALMQNSNSNIAMTSRDALRASAERIYASAEWAGKKGKAAGMWALTKGYQVADKIERDRTKKAMGAVASAAADYEVDYAALEEKKVERPVLDPQKVINVQTVDGHLERVDAPTGRQTANGAVRNAAVAAQQPQETMVRPRMDNCQVIRTETVNGHLTRPDTVRASDVQQPRNASAARNTEGGYYVQTPTQQTIPSSFAPDVTASEPQRPKLYAAVKEQELLEEEQISQPEVMPVEEAPQPVAPVRQARPVQAVEAESNQPTAVRRQPTKKRSEIATAPINSEYHTQTPTQQTISSSFAPDVTASEPQRPKLYAVIKEPDREPLEEEKQVSQPKTAISQPESMSVEEAPQPVTPVRQSRLAQAEDTNFKQPAAVPTKKRPELATASSISAPHVTEQGEIQDNAPEPQRPKLYAAVKESDRELFEEEQQISQPKTAISQPGSMAVEEAPQLVEPMRQASTIQAAEAEANQAAAATSRRRSTKQTKRSKEIATAPINSEYPTQQTIPSISAPDVTASEAQRPKLYAAIKESDREPLEEEQQIRQMKTAISQSGSMAVEEVPQPVAPVRQVRPAQALDTNFNQPSAAVLRQQPTAEQHQDTISAPRLQQAGQIPLPADAGTKASKTDIKKQTPKRKKAPERQPMPSETAGTRVVEAHAAERAAKVSRPRSAARKK